MAAKNGSWTFLRQGHVGELSGSSLRKDEDISNSTLVHNEPHNAVRDGTLYFGIDINFHMLLLFSSH